MTLRSSLALLGALAALPACSTVVCAHGEYFGAECRVAAENHYARLRTSTGVTLAFQEPDAEDAETWVALGLLQEFVSGTVRARPSTLMDFALSIEPGELGATEVTLTLENVATDAVITVGPIGAEGEVPAVAVGTRRELQVPLGAETVWVRGTRPCPSSYRVAVAGDVQTNPLQFERLLEQLQDEVVDAEAAGEPLLGFVLLGDLAEKPVEEELAHIGRLLNRSPVPVSVVPGNHDVHGNELALYNRLFGAGNYSQAVCTARLTLLDTGGGDLAGSVQARLPELLDRTSFDFLVAGAHYPAWPGRTGNTWGDSDAANYLLSELARNDADLYVSGHYHGWEESEAIPVGDREVHQIITGTAGASQGAGKPRFGFTRLSFSGAGLASCFVEVLPPGRLEGGAGTIEGIRFCP
jgi:hypothetical protein